MIQKIVHIVLAMMVLLSSSGFIVQRHFCQNELKSVSIYLKPDHCHTESVATKSQDELNENLKLRLRGRGSGYKEGP